MERRATNFDWSKITKDDIPALLDLWEAQGLLNPGDEHDRLVEKLRQDSRQLFFDYVDSHMQVGADRALLAATLGAFIYSGCMVEQRGFNMGVRLPPRREFAQPTTGCCS